MSGASIYRRCALFPPGASPPRSLPLKILEASRGAQYLHYLVRTSAPSDMGRRSRGDVPT
eukprot:9473561-Pyramimonas_sp.AAC.1